MCGYKVDAIIEVYGVPSLMCRRRIWPDNDIRKISCSSVLDGQDLIGIGIRNRICPVRLPYEVPDLSGIRAGVSIGADLYIRGNGIGFKVLPGIKFDKICVKVRLDIIIIYDPVYARRIAVSAGVVCCHIR